MGKYRTDKSFFRQNVVDFMTAFLCLIIAFSLGYFRSFSTTIECERTEKNSEALCSISKHYYLRPTTKKILIKQPIKKIYFKVNDAGLTYDNHEPTCRLEVEKFNQEVIFPIGIWQTEYQCQSKFQEKLGAVKKLIKDANIVNKETITLKYNMPLVLKMVFLGTFGIFSVLGIFFIFGLVLRSLYNK